LELREFARFLGAFPKNNYCSLSIYNLISLRGTIYLFHNIQTGSGAHPASYPMGTEGVKEPEREANNSLSSNAYVKNGGAELLPIHVFITYRDNLAFLSLNNNGYMKEFLSY
jgi:hypothetical protein